ncbi:hypothetical protein Tco_0945800 [Tanacetum coccineum]
MGRRYDTVPLCIVTPLAGALRHQRARGNVASQVLRYRIQGSEYRNVTKRDTFWYKVLGEFNRNNFQQCNKDMLTSKWHTLNHNCQKFNAVFKRVKHLGKSEENELDVIKGARTTYHDENKGKSFQQEDAWEILKLHSKWDTPEPVISVELTEGNKSPGVGTRSYSVKIQDHDPRQILSHQKTKSDTTTSIGGSNSSNLFMEMMSSEFRRNAELAYEV